MTSYDDIIADGNNLVYMGKWDQNANKNNTTAAGFKLWNYGLKAAPKKGVSIAHNWTQEDKFKDGKHKVTDKNATKFGMKHKDANLAIALAQDKWSAGVDGQIADGDWKVEAGVKVENKPQNEIKVNVESSIESPDMSGATTVINLGYESKSAWNANDNKYDHQKDQEISVSAGIKYENTMAGFSMAYDMEKVGGKELIVAQKDGKNKFWAGYALDDQFAKAGLLWNIPEHRYTLAAELRHNSWENAPKGLFDQPMVFTFGGKAVLSDWTSLNWMLELGSSRHVMCKAEHKIDPHWKLSMTQSYDMAKVENKNQYQVGFDVNYTL